MTTDRHGPMSPFDRAYPNRVRERGSLSFTERTGFLDPVRQHR
jgi:hypothetical protein